MGIGQQYQIKPSEEPDNPVVTAPIEGLYMVALEYDPDVFQCPTKHSPGRQKSAAVVQPELYGLEETSSQNV